MLTYVVETDVHGGAEVYVATLAKAFGARVVSAGPVPEATRAAIPGIETAPRPRRKTDLIPLVRLAGALRHADLVHVNASEPANARYAMAAARIARRRYVVTLHTPGALAGGAQDAVLKDLYGGAVAVIAVSREIADVLRPLGVEAVVIPNGVPVPPPAPRRDVRGRVTVGTLARLVPEKGVDVLLAATDDLDVDVEVGGTGPLTYEGRATFRGRVDADAFLRDVDVFALASRVEGLPFALLEAMALGLPCVATRVGDVPEALDGVGILVDRDDVDGLRAAIARLAKDPQERARLGDAARKRVEERYSVEVMIERTASVYLRPAAPRPPRAR